MYSQRLPPAFAMSTSRNPGWGRTSGDEAAGVIISLEEFEVVVFETGGEP